MIGPTTGAVSAGQVMVAIACITPDFGVLRSTRFRPTGIIRAAAEPCAARAATNSGRVPAAAQAAEAAAKPRIAATSTSRSPRRSASQPAGGISAAMVRR